MRALLPSPLRGGVGGGGIAPEGVNDYLSNTVEILQSVVIPKSQNAKVLTSKMRVPVGIRTLPCIGVVLPTIDFDNETCRITSEVHDEAVDRHLPAKMKALRL